MILTSQYAEPCTSVSLLCPRLRTMNESSRYASNSCNQRLRYHIRNASGEDPDYPARELLMHHAQGRGWQSPRFCSYPQELEIQLDQPSRLSSIQLLCHEYKIPRLVTIFVSNLPLNCTDPSQAVERRLGHVRMDDNHRSSYQARELKTIQLGHISATSVRFVLDQCHVNEHNIYNQVGIVAVNIVGVHSSPAVSFCMP
jgi:centrosomal protein CEP104